MLQMKAMCLYLPDSFQKPLVCTLYGTNHACAKYHVSNYLFRLQVGYPAILHKVSLLLFPVLAFGPCNDGRFHALQALCCIAGMPMQACSADVSRVTSSRLLAYALADAVMILLFL